MVINKVLLYSTGNYIQYPVINHNGKEYEKEYIYMCIYMCVCVYMYKTESLCCTPETIEVLEETMVNSHVNLEWERMFKP